MSKHGEFESERLEHYIAALEIESFDGCSLWTIFKLLICWISYTSRLIMTFEPSSNRGSSGLREHFTLIAASTLTVYYFSVNTLPFVPYLHVHIYTNSIPLLTFVCWL